MRVLLAPHGTRGDVQPMLALASALRDRGYTAVFSAPSNSVAGILAAGFEAESNGIDVEAVLRSGAEFDSLRWQMRHLAELTAQLFESVAAASDGADLIVGSGVQMAAASVAEWRGVPYASAAFCPCVVPGGGSPPPMVRTQTLPLWINRLLWTVGFPMASLALRGAINRGRAALRLPAIYNALGHLAGDRILLAADRDLAPLADDAPEIAVATDAWILHDTADLDPRVAAFLAVDPAPIYVGFGSMVAKRVPVLAEHAVAAARALGRRAIIAGGWSGLDRHVLSADDILAVDAVPHALVFPRVSAIVHHGGAGTTTAAASSGIAQVILPHILDQFYWAHRVERLGIGPRALPVDLITADILTDRLDAALGDPVIRRRAATLGPLIAARNGADAAVDEIERLAS